MQEKKGKKFGRIRTPFVAGVVVPVIIASVIIGAGIPTASGHSLFNSAEQTIGDYRMQIATLPEFPQVGETSKILFRFTDKDLAEVSRFTMGIRVFYNDERIETFAPRSIDDGHWEMNYVFQTGGNHIFKVDVYDVGEQGVLTYTFNMSTQSPFGYVFFIAITIGAVMFAIVVGYIYLPQRFQKTN